MKIVTASKEMGDPLDPEGDNVLALYKLFASEADQATMADRYRAGDIGYGQAKQALFELVNAELEEPRARYDELMAHPDRIEAVLNAGAERARVAARATMERVRQAVGLR